MTRTLFLSVASLTMIVLGSTSCTEQPSVTSSAMAGSNAMDMPMPDGRAVDMASVPLYPGSRMVDMKIAPHQPDDMVDMAYDNPANSTVVRAWYADTLSKKGFALREDGTALIGVDPAGKVIRIDIQPAANGHSTGLISRG